MLVAAALHVVQHLHRARAAQAVVVTALTDLGPRVHLTQVAVGAVAQETFPVTAAQVS
jgi:ribosomal protein S7